MIDSPYFEDLVRAFSKLPGVGKKTATRYAFNILNLNEDDAFLLSESIINCKENIKTCTVCGNYTDQDICNICRERDKNVICIVSEAKDIISIEKAHIFDGVYHVLGGLIAPIKGINPENLRFKELLDRLEGVQEIIIALSFSSEGSITASYIKSLLKDKNIKITTLAQGISLGNELEFVDGETMRAALNGRIEF